MAGWRAKSSQEGTQNGSLSRPTDRSCHLVVRDLDASRRFYEAVHHGAAKRSADAVVVTAEM